MVFTARGPGVRETTFLFVHMANLREDWSSLGHLPMSEGITVAGRMGCSDGPANVVSPFLWQREVWGTIRDNPTRIP